MLAQIPGAIEKSCLKCKETKSISEFSIHGVSKRPMHICSSCFKASITNGRKNNKTVQKHVGVNVPNRITASKKTVGPVTKKETKLALHFLSYLKEATTSEVASYLGATYKRTNYVLNTLQSKHLITPEKYDVPSYSGQAKQEMKRWNITESAKEMMDLLG
jgi:hypothetical protein